MTALPFAADVVVKATALIVATACLTFAARERTTAAARHGMWAALFAALLVLPAAVAFGPRVSLPVLAAPAPLAVTAAASVPVAVLVADDAPRLAASAAVAHPEPARHAPARPSPATLLMALWALGALACVARIVAGHIALRRLVRRASDADDAWRALFADEAARAGVHARVRLLLHDGVAAPATWGVRSPVIVLPRDASAWPATRRRMALRHELAHVARRDALVQSIAGVACALYWFHPGVWLAARRLVAEREHACDDRVLALGSGPADYAAELLEVARAARSSGLPALVTVSMARRSELEGRLLAVLDTRRARGRPSRAATLAAALLCAALVTGLSAFRAVPRAAIVRAAVVRPPAAEPNVVRHSSDDSTFERSLPATSGGTLTLDLRTGGAVDITGGDEARVTVRGTLGGHSWRATRVTFEEDGGGRVRLRAVYDGTDDVQSFSHRFVITVPRRYDVRLNSAGGGVTVHDLEGTIGGTTGGGRILLERVRGYASLRTGGGDVRVSDTHLSGTVTTGGGSVTIERNEGDLRGASGTGDVSYDARSNARARIAPELQRQVDSLTGPRVGSGTHTLTITHATTSIMSTPDKLVDIDTIPRPRAVLDGRGVRYEGMLRVQKSGGAIALDEAPHGAVISTGGGAVWIGRATGVLSATTGGGNISLGPVDGSAEGHTGSGDVKITVVGDGRARHDVYVTSGSGAADVWLPADFAGRLDLETAYTDNNGRRTHIESDWDVSVTESPDWDDRQGTPRKYVRGSATLGSGPSVVRVRVVNGDVRIHRGS